MREQRDGVWPRRLLDAGRRFHEGAHDRQLAEHRGREQRGLRAVSQQELSDFATAGVGGGAERGLPVAEAPVHGGTRQRGLTFDQFAHACDVAVRHAHHLLGEGRILTRKRVWEGGRGGLPAGMSRRRQRGANQAAKRQRVKEPATGRAERTDGRT